MAEKEGQLDSLIDVPKERKYSDGERPNSRSDRRSLPIDTYSHSIDRENGDGKNASLTGDEEGEELSKVTVVDNMPPSLEKLAMIRKEEEKLRVQKDLMKKELKRQKTMKKDKRDSRRLPKDVLGR